jgi:hypothetical protein
MSNVSIKENAGVRKSVTSARVLVKRRMKMSKEQRIPIDEDCFICGSQFTLITKVEQKCTEYCTYDSEYHVWHAAEGDNVVCEECKAEGYIVIGDYAEVDHSEESEHNRKCYDQYVAKEKREGNAENPIH